MCRAASILYFNALFFCFPLFFEDLWSSTLESTKWLTVLINHTYPSRLAWSIHPLIFYNSWGLYISLQNTSWVFSQTSIPAGKSFKFVVFTSLENACIESRDFYSSFLLPHSKPVPQSSYHPTLGRRKLRIPPGSIFSKICFQEKEVEEHMICFIKI